MTDFPIRPAFWNVPVWAEIGVYVIGLLAVGLFIFGLKQAYKRWKAGQEKDLPQDNRRRWLGLWRDAFMQRRLMKTPEGVLHFCIFWGFIILFWGTATATLDWDVAHLIFGEQFLKGNFYLFYKLVLDLGGLACLFGLAWAAWRRFVQHKRALEASRRFAWVLGSLAGIILTGYCVEGLRLYAMDPPWAIFSPVGLLFAKGFASLIEPSQIHGVHLTFWVLHAIAALMFIAVLPFTYFAHAVNAPLNIFYRKLEPKGALSKIEDIEEQESFGISKFEQFTWKQRLEFDACTECGRCTQVCPAVQSGSPLDPRALVLKLKQEMHEPSGSDLIGSVVTKEELWSCTTCGACAQACPVRLDLPSAIVEMRRHLALEQGDFPAGLPNALQNTQTVGNPWGMDPSERLNWAEGLDVPIAQEGQMYDYIYWVGCSASYDRRAQKIARAMVKILKAAQVRFAVMQEERCHGDFARRVGEEYTYQLAALENIENLSKYQFKHIVAHCPHCFNTLKNEYPAFEGGKFHVVSHTHLIQELLVGKRIKLKDSNLGKVVYHDPCYMARYNDSVGTPRKIMDAVPGLERTETMMRGKQALCCGAGGGQMWTEGETKRINVIRFKDLRQSAPTIAVGCPHCLSMLESARRENQATETSKIMDISEIVAEALQE